jgi:RNA polymerase sigma-70 factor (ECF subfamily)
VILSIFKSGGNYAELTPKEYQEVFDQFYNNIRGYIYFKCGDQDLAEDLAQDTFIKLWENRSKIDRSTVKSYLYTIAGNLTINYLKRQQLKYKFVNQSEQRTEKSNPEFILEMKEYEAKLQGVIETLPEGSREVFLMNRLEDIKYKDIAERLGISVKAVEKRMSKALKIIRDSLGVDI